MILKNLPGSWVSLIDFLARRFNFSDVQISRPN